MRKFISIALLLLMTGRVQAQEWISFSQVGDDNVLLTEINIDQNTNNVVYSHTFHINWIRPDGSNTTFGHGLEDYQTPGSVNTGYPYYHNGAIFYASYDHIHKLILTPQYKDTVLHITNVAGMLIDHDTIWVSGDNPGDPTQIINESIHNPFTMYLTNLVKYKGQVYGYNDFTEDVGIAYHNGSTFIQFKEDNSDILSNYIGGICTNNENGVMFIGTKEGISQFNGATFNNITPDTDPDMPYKTVIDIEYDHKNGKLWMILGDTNFNAKTLTSYNGSWETYDHINSPIGFDDFEDMAVDTLGQVWVGETNEIHVLNTNQLEGWLGVEKQEQQKFNVNVFPNPSNGIVNIQIEKEGVFTLKIFNTNGQEVYNDPRANGTVELDLPKGMYHYNISDGNQSFKTGKIIKL